MRWCAALDSRSRFNRPRLVDKFAPGGAGDTKRTASVSTFLASSAKVGTQSSSQLPSLIPGQFQPPSSTSSHLFNLPLPIRATDRFSLPHLVDDEAIQQKNELIATFAARRFQPPSSHPRGHTQKSTILTRSLARFQPPSPRRRGSRPYSWSRRFNLPASSTRPHASARTRATAPTSSFHLPRLIGEVALFLHATALAGQTRFNLPSLVDEIAPITEFVEGSRRDVSTFFVRRRRRHAHLVVSTSLVPPTKSHHRRSRTLH